MTDEEKKAKALDAAETLMKGSFDNEDPNPAWVLCGMAIMMFPQLEPNFAAVERMAAFCDEKVPLQSEGKN